jgi:sulfopyruvate decarboxylase TPP-binding subunit
MLGLRAFEELLLTVGVDAAVGVPDTILAGVFARLSVPVFTAPREDVAVAAAVGLELGGRRPVLFMKNAGLLTCGDALLSLARDCRVGLLLVVGWAGIGDDQLPHHTVTGAVTVPFLDALRIPWRMIVLDVPDPDGGFGAWYRAARAARSHCALLVPPAAVAA